MKKLITLILILVSQCSYAETMNTENEQLTNNGTWVIINEQNIEDIYQNSLQTRVREDKIDQILTNINSWTLSTYMWNKLLLATTMDTINDSYIISFPSKIKNNEIIKKRLFRKIRNYILINYIENWWQLTQKMFKNVSISKDKNWYYIVEDTNHEMDLINMTMINSVQLNNEKSTPQLLFKNMLFDWFEFESRIFPLSNELLSQNIIFNKDDIYTLFNVVSYKYRSLNSDPAYRKYNIGKAYSIIWWSNWIYPLNSWATFSYNEFLRWVMNAKTFKYGSVIKWNDIKDDLWGWLCWGSTWIFQWGIYNRSLSLVWKNHSQYYHNLYDSIIQWKKNSIPWLDIAYWTDSSDLKIQNTSDYPVILVNKLENNYEYNFTLNYKEDDNTPSDVIYKWKNGSCYSWDINGKTIKSCYKKVL